MERPIDIAFIHQNGKERLDGDKSKSNSNSNCELIEKVKDKYALVSLSDIDDISILSHVKIAILIGDDMTLEHAVNHGYDAFGAYIVCQPELTAAMGKRNTNDPCTLLNDYFMRLPALVTEQHNKSRQIKMKQEIDQMTTTEQMDSDIPVQLLWYGDHLTNNEILCINSYLANGHLVHLYTYKEIDNLPTHMNLVVKDGTEIIPEKDVFSYKKGDGKGSFSGFSNNFRYKLLLEKGGWWSDMDMVCFKNYSDLIEGKDYLFCRENDTQIASSVIFCRNPGSPVMKWCLSEATRLSRDLENLEWGTIGPKLLMKGVLSHNLQEKYCLDRVTFFPVPYTEMIAMLYVNMRIVNGMYGIHLWNEVWRRQGLDKNGTYAEGSLYEELKRKYL